MPDDFFVEPAAEKERALMPARGKISAEQSHHDHGISDYIYVRM